MPNPCPECGTPVPRKFCTNCGLPNKDMLKKLAMPNGGERILAEKTLYPCCLFSWMFCCAHKVVITDKRIDTESGFCGSKLDTIDMRRVTDVGFDRGCCQRMMGRGTVIIMSRDETTPELRLSSCGAKAVYDDLKRAWNNTSDLRTVVD